MRVSWIWLMIEDERGLSFLKKNDSNITTETRCYGNFEAGVASPSSDGLWGTEAYFGNERTKRILIIGAPLVSRRTKLFKNSRSWTPDLAERAEKGMCNLKDVNLWIEQVTPSCMILTQKFLSATVAAFLGRQLLTVYLMKRKVNALQEDLTIAANGAPSYCVLPAAAATIFVESLSSMPSASAIDSPSTPQISNLLMLPIRRRSTHDVLEHKTTVTELEFDLRSSSLCSTHNRELFQKEKPKCSRNYLKTSTFLTLRVLRRCEKKRIDLQPPPSIFTTEQDPRSSPLRWHWPGDKAIETESDVRFFDIRKGRWHKPVYLPYRLHRKSDVPQRVAAQIRRLLDSQHKRDFNVNGAAFALPKANNLFSRTERATVAVSNSIVQQPFKSFRKPLYDRRQCDLSKCQKCSGLGKNCYFYRFKRALSAGSSKRNRSCQHQTRFSTHPFLHLVRRWTARSKHRRPPGDSDFYEHVYFIRDMKRFYALGNTLGVGGEGEVKMCSSVHLLRAAGINKDTLNWDLASSIISPGVFYAMKILPGRNCGLSEGDLVRRRSIAHLLCSFRHMNVMRYRAMYEDRDCSYLLMDLARGPDLLDYVTMHQKSNGGLDESLCRALFRQVLKSLEYVHSQRLIHRDVKLENFVCAAQYDLIEERQCENSMENLRRFHRDNPSDVPFLEKRLIEHDCRTRSCTAGPSCSSALMPVPPTSGSPQRGNVRVPRILLIDFGLACFVQEASWTPPNGTPLYMAPELHQLYTSTALSQNYADDKHDQVAKKSPRVLHGSTGIVEGSESLPPFAYDEAIDLWAAGIILSQLLTGQVPFDTAYEDESESFSIRRPSSTPRHRYPDGPFGIKKKQSFYLPSQCSDTGPAVDNFGMSRDLSHRSPSGTTCCCSGSESEEHIGRTACYAEHEGCTHTCVRQEACFSCFKASSVSNCSIKPSNDSSCNTGCYQAPDASMPLTSSRNPGSPLFESTFQSFPPVSHISFRAKEWRCVSREAKDLICGLLQVNPGLRLSAQEALAHPWFQCYEVRRIKKSFSVKDYGTCRCFERSTE